MAAHFSAPPLERFVLFFFFIIFFFTFSSFYLTLFHLLIIIIIELKQQNESWKQQIATLANEVKSTRDKFQATNSSGKTLHNKAESIPQFLSDEKQVSSYQQHDSNIPSASMATEFKNITRRLNDLSSQV